MLQRARHEPSSPAVLQLVPRLDADETTEATLDTARALKAAGWRALIASAGGPMERELRPSGAELVRLPFDLTGPWRDWQNARTIARIARQERVAVVHARTPGTAVLATETGRGRPGLVVTAHVMPEAKGRRDAPYRAALRMADRVIGLSEFAAEELVAGIEVPLERVSVLPPWVDMREFDPDRVRGHRVAAAAERCGLTLGPRVIAVPADIAAGDGRELLLQSLARTREEDYLLLLVGPLPGGRDALAKLNGALRAAGLHDRARFATAVDDLPAVLATIDLLLVPATRPTDGANFLALAAQAMGRPVILTTTGALPEFLMPAVTGWLLPPDDPGEIAWAIGLALQMGEDVRERVARRARDFVATNFGAKTVLARQLDLYTDLLAPRPRVAAE